MEQTNKNCQYVTVEEMTEIINSKSSELQAEMGWNTEEAKHPGVFNPIERRFHKMLKILSKIDVTSAKIMSLGLLLLIRDAVQAGNLCQQLKSNSCTSCPDKDTENCNRNRS